MTSLLKTNSISAATGSTVSIPSGITLEIASGATLSGADMGLASVQTFTSSGTWTKPSGITKVVVEVQGGGSSGSDGNATSARHTQGGAGGYAKKFIDVSSISSATITVGSGGAGATSYPSNAGGDSSWADGTNTVTGGGAGVAGTADYVGGLGGTASGGDININGQSGGSYAVYMAGSSPLGLGGVHSARQTGNSNTGSEEPTGYGAGSTGLYGNGTTRDGRPGIVIVWEFK